MEKATKLVEICLAFKHNLFKACLIESMNNKTKLRSMKTPQDKQFFNLACSINFVFVPIVTRLALKTALQFETFPSSFT